MEYPAYIRKIADQYWRGRASVYTILDIAHDEIIYAKMVHSDIEYICLYEGEHAEELEDLAPYLIRLHKNNPFTEWLSDNGGGKNRGIFVQSSADLNTLAGHFRRFVKVYDEDGMPMMFRFYDPRVLRVYLPTCNRAEREFVFGPVERYYAEGRDGKMIIYASDEGRQIMRGEKKESVLIIRKEQMEAFERDALERFEDEMMVHSKDFSPRLCEVIGDDQLRAAIRSAMKRAGRYGFTNSSRLSRQMNFTENPISAV